MASTQGFDNGREFWDARLAADTYIFGTEPNAFLTSQEALVGWDIETLREYEAVLNEGPKRCGMAVLIDLVARKPII